jgi:hypothetical protein
MVFIFSLQVVLGDINLVYMLDDWEALEKFAGNTPGLHQVIEREGKFEIRVRIGDCGWKEEFATDKDQRYIDALDFCWKHCVKISGNTPDSLFFKP